MRGPPVIVGMRGFRVKMTVMIVLVVLASSGLLSLMSYRRARNSMVSQSDATYSLAAEKYAQELSSWVNSNGAIVNTIAAEIEISGICDWGYEEFHNYLKAGYDSINRDGVIYDIYFTYPDNTMACASDFQTDGSVDYVHDRLWYTIAKDTRELYYSSPYRDSDTKQPIITISKAVYSGDELKGVLAADIFVDILVDIIHEANVADNSYAFLVDQNMGMIVHPNPEYSFDDVPTGILKFPDSPYVDVVANIRSNSMDMVYVEDYDGVTRGIVVSEMENTGWHVGIATSKAEMMKGLSGLVRGFLIAAVVAVFIGGAFAVVLAYVLDKLRRQQQEYEEHVLKLEKQAADEASEAKSRFLADMSHEIRTPINAILGMNEMIIRETESKEIMGYSKNIRQSGQNLLQLVNSILDFSKIENGKMEIVPGSYSVKEQIGYIINSISERARAKGLELKMDIDPQIPCELYGDNTRINEVIMNLLTNAVKYTESGSVTLSIKGKDRKEDPEKSILLYVEVTDTGIGIKESDMDRLFESFERLDVERNRNIEGTGLGISVCTKLLELMDSKLQVRSVYGEGSTFWFEIRQKIVEDEPLGDYKLALLEEENEFVYHESFRAPTARILVVDDTKMNILVTANFLKKTGVRISTALSGEEAIRLASENEYDLILMDQRMPGMDGTEAMKRIKDLENKKNTNTPFICLTADVIRGARERYLQEGFDNYLMKPVDSRELEKMLLDYLPKEKIELTDSKEEEVPSSREGSNAELFADLAKAGVDSRTGLFFCQRDEDMYKSILSEFCIEQKTKSLNLQNCYERKDWKNYEIHAHSLKSTSKTIGAKKLSELAADLEDAAGAEDEMALREGHDKMMEMYSAIVSVIEKDLGMENTDIRENDEIFEFLPEGNGEG